MRSFKSLNGGTKCHYPKKPKLELEGLLVRGQSPDYLPETQKRIALMVAFLKRRATLRITCGSYHGIAGRALTEKPRH